MVKLQVNDDCTSQSFLDGLIKPTPQYKAIAAIGPFFFFFSLLLVIMFTARAANG